MTLQDRLRSIRRTFIIPVESPNIFAWADEAADALDAKDAEIERLHLAIINLTHPDLMMGGTWIQHYCRAEDLTEAGRLCKHVSDDKGRDDES